jgi:competence protein ComEC
VGGDRLAALIDRQRPNLALWTPALFAAGIGAYFASPAEPPSWMLAAAVLLLAATAFRLDGVARMLVVALLLPGAGFTAAGLRSLAVAGPVLPHERTAAVEGRVIGLSRSASDAPRVLLDQVVIHGLAPEATPRRVRVSLGPATDPALPRPGLRLIGTVRLSPPGGPAEPGGFDFRRLAWFERLGAVGYARTPMLEMEGSDHSGLRQAAFRVQAALSDHVRGTIPGQNGAFAAAIFTGDRSAIDAGVEEDLRVSTLYHVVSIGGLHMGLLAGAVFALLRYGLALVPGLALAWPLKKIAAAAALLVTGAYLAVSGFDVAAQRAYVMTSVFLLAVLLDRPALTMRSVALSAFVVLIAAPESLTGAGFQMSFAGALALIAAFEALRDRPWWNATQTEARWRFLKPLLGAFMTSLVAGVATVPFSVYHFNVLAQYGLLANLLAMPAIGLVVMPAAVVALFAAPFGLDWLPLTVAGWGIGYFLAVADWVAGLGGAATGVPAAPPVTLALLALGGLVLVLWIGRGRWLGLAPVGLALALWAAHPRPDVLIADNGRLFGVMTDAGRALSTPTGAGYAAESWLENDGDLATQAEAHARGAFDLARHRIAAPVPGFGDMVYLGRSAPDPAECVPDRILIAPNWPSAPEGPCLFVSEARLRADGALAVWLTSEGPRVEGALSRRERPWTRDPAAPRAPALAALR